MPLKELNATRRRNYITMFLLLSLFTFSLYSINIIYPKLGKGVPIHGNTKKAQEIGRFAIPFMTLLSFFTACVVVATMISDGNSNLLSKPRDQFAGIYFLGIAGVILTIMNFTVLKEHNLKDYIKGKKFSVIGAFMALGVSAIVFGFLDNFGMKLGTEALDDNFVQMFLGPFSTHKRYGEYKESIGDNLKIINGWAGGRWRTIINQVLRCKDDLEELSKKTKSKDSRLKDLVKDINKFVDNGAEPLIIPEALLKKNNNDNSSSDIRNYIKNVKEKYDMIDGSKSMMGNTFSDFIGAILGAAIINLFTYMTSYDGIYTGDDSIDNSGLISNLNKLAPFMEALFISIGCLIPIFLNIAITRDPTSSNNAKAWTVVISVGIIMSIMMYLSVRGTKDMNTEDKKRSINKTLTDLTERLNITEEDGNLNTTVKDFLAKVNTM